MKIGEAQQIYREQVTSYREQKSVLSKQLKDIRSRMKYAPEHRKEYESQAAALELTLNALDEKQTEYQDYLSELAEKYCAYWNAVVAEQQEDMTKEYTDDMAKIFEVARRLMKGAIVPGSDERRLMEYSMEMYKTAKNIGAMIQRQKREKYDSLWGDEEEKEYADPAEEASDAPAGSGGPEIVEAADLVASVEM